MVVDDDDLRGREMVAGTESPPQGKQPPAIPGRDGMGEHANCYFGMPCGQLVANGCQISRNRVGMFRRE
jgi:hypothetical protein